MAGSISLSLSQQFDELGRPLSDGRLYVYAAETTTPQNAYQDSGLAVAHPWPVELDSAGRIPQLYFADGSIKIRLADQYGVTQIGADNVLVIGPSTTTSGDAVDPTTLVQTGQVALWYGTGVRTGFVRLNGRTLGSASSGATERANADTEDLFVFLYNEDANLAVSGGRGASAAADFAANKRLTLPDYRGRVPCGLDDMGNSPAGILTAIHYGTDPTILGSASSAGQSRAIGTTNLPPYTPAGTVSITPAGTISQITPAGTITDGAITIGGAATSAVAGTTAVAAAGHAFADVGPAIAATQSGSMFVGTPVTPTFTGTPATPALSGTPQGGLNTPLSIIQPSVVMTLYCKL